MSNNGTLLVWNEDDPIAASVAEHVQAWHEGMYVSWSHPRTVWLADVMMELQTAFPHASAGDLRLTARHHAPFYLQDGPNVP